MDNSFVVCNLKGGVGKTSTAVNLAAFTAKDGRRTLLIDCDPQGHVGSLLGIKKKELVYTLADLITKNTPAQDAIIEVRDNLFVLPSTEASALAELELREKYSREQILAKILEPVLDSYDLVILDTSPAPNFLTINAIIVAKKIIIPISTLIAWESAINTANLITELAQAGLIKPNIYALQTFFRANVTECVELRRQLTDAFGDHLLNTAINLNARLSLAAGEGKPITDYPSSIPGYIDYRSLCNEIKKICANSVSRRSKARS